MKIGLHDSEAETLRKKTFPDYALMKISAWHKSQGDTVEWWYPSERNDRMGIVPNRLQLEFSQRYIYSGKYRTETWDEYCKRLNIRG